MNKKKKGKIKHSAAYIAKQLLKLFGKGGKHWVNGYFAYSKDGHSIDPKEANPKVDSFCLVGGMRHLGLPTDPILKALKKDPEICTDYGDPYDSIELFNDADGWSPIRKFLTRVAKA
jgi:hypothetical protein